MKICDTGLQNEPIDIGNKYVFGFRSLRSLEKPDAVCHSVKIAIAKQIPGSILPEVLPHDRKRTRILHLETARIFKTYLDARIVIKE